MLFVLIESNKIIHHDFISQLKFFFLGRASWTRHIRNGKELPEIARDDHYDFNFQVCETTIYLEKYFPE